MEHRNENGTAARQSLMVLEYPYTYAAWHMDCKDPERVYSVRKPFSSKRRALEDYRLCGVYGKAGVPWEAVEINGEKYPELEPYQAIPLHFAEECQKAVENNKMILVSSGYCAFAPAIYGGLQQALGSGKKVGVIWVDAHCDNIVIETTDKSDMRFVGVPLSTISGQTMVQWGKDFCKMIHPCEGSYILLSDGRCSGEEELTNLRSAGIRRLNEDAFEDSAQWKKAVDDLAARVDAIFLMVDADIMNGHCIPAYFEPEPGGHDVTKVMENVRIVMDTGKVAAFSCFCVDFDKYDQGGDVTYLNGMRVIGAGLEAWGEANRRGE